ncbi:Protein of unknown function [Gryllus bimaculatus]|nr:Protein of unknown function [Gryllus bimaculatus]
MSSGGLVPERVVRGLVDCVELLERSKGEFCSEDELSSAWKTSLIHSCNADLHPKGKQTPAGVCVDRTRGSLVQFLFSY